jgi:hypothetical protein
MQITVGIVLGLVFAAFGAISVAWSLWKLFQAARSKRWPKADGLVVVSQIQQTPDIDGGFMYRPELSYRYTVNGTKFVASRLRFGAPLSLNWSAPAVRITRKYAAGSHVTVFHDPRDPGKAVLEPGVTTLVWLSLAGGVLFLVLAVAFLATAG